MTRTNRDLAVDALDRHPDRELATEARWAMMKFTLIQEALTGATELPGFLPLTQNQRAFLATDAGKALLANFLERNRQALATMDMFATQLVTDEYTRALRSFIARVGDIQSALCAGVPSLAR